MENDRAKFKNDFKAKIYNWVLKIVKFVESLPRSSINDVMGKQLLRSGTSVIANYVEANSASSKKDFINFFTHALKSANESKVWLALFGDVNNANKMNTESLAQELNEISKVLASSILTMKGKK